MYTSGQRRGRQDFEQTGVGGSCVRVTISNHPAPALLATPDEPIDYHPTPRSSIRVLKFTVSHRLNVRVVGLFTDW